MKPMSGFTLVVAAVLTSPALASAAVGEMAVDIALTRYLLAVGVCWLLLTVASEWFWSEPTAAPVRDEATTTDAGGSAGPARDVVPRTEPEGD